MMIRKYAIAIGLFLTFALVGCSTLEKVSSELGNSRTKDYPQLSNTVKQGCIGGFAAGVVHSYIKEGKFDARKAFRDGIVGAVLGCTLAEGLDRRRENFSTDANHFDAEIKDARHQNGQMKSLVAHTRTLTKESRATLDKLQAAQSKKTLEQNAVSTAASNASADLRWANKELKVARGNLEQRQAASARMTEKGDGSRANAMNAEVRALQKYVNNLESEVASLASINDAIGQLNV